MNDLNVETTLKAMEAAESESSAALREATETIVAGFRRLGVAFARAEEAGRLSVKLRKAGVNVAARDGLSGLAVQGMLQEAIEASYGTRDLEGPWGETIKLTIAPRDCVAKG